MIEHHKILQWSQQIAQTFQPEQIILFGSYAYGQPTDSSDVDLLVIMPFKGQPFHQAMKILTQTNPDFAVDLLVRTPTQIQQLLDWNDFFIREIVDKGTILYAAPHARVA
ncbi:nucleotidyltransferase domain-containing protein [Altericista sp. CCNU0014]|uniref:nucleotidyltransferase domain-containing protein n=1 Tax=Altericista sp. CCNU0014 TaxID=3082949 RepID=UPI00384A557E